MGSLQTNLLFLILFTVVGQLVSIISLMYKQKKMSLAKRETLSSLRRYGLIQSHPKALILKLKTITPKCSQYLQLLFGVI